MNQYLLDRCGEGDTALGRTAARLAQRQADDQPPLDMGEINFAMRAEGAPYVWPRAWSLEGKPLKRQEIFDRMQRWLSSFYDGGQRRCGIATVEESDGTQVIAAVALDALADLSPMPTQVRPGEWVNIEARLLVPATDAKVIVLAPGSDPYGITSSLSDGVVHARFNADRAGEWLVQVLADVNHGPRPVLEALVHAGESPPTEYHASRAPGESALFGAFDDRDAIFRMLNAAREQHGLSRLHRDKRLDAVAQAHARAMRNARRIGHDVGLGDPRSRVQRAQINVALAGENVAHAASLERAHRALWASPSHRGNILQQRFEAVGVGVAHDVEGGVWVCQVFAGFQG